MKLHFMIDGKQMHEQDSTIAPSVKDTITFRPPTSSAVSGVVVSRHFNFPSEGTQEVIIRLGPIQE